MFYATFLPILLQRVWCYIDEVRWSPGLCFPAFQVICSRCAPLWAAPTCLCVVAALQCHPVKQWYVGWVWPWPYMVSLVVSAIGSTLVHGFGVPMNCGSGILTASVLTDLYVAVCSVRSSLPGHRGS